MQVDFLIIGQGIAGTLLSHALLKAGRTVLVMDEGNMQRSSLVAGALINPMAGKHWTPSKDAPLFIPKAIETYRELESLLGASLLTPTDLYVFHQDEAGRDAFAEKQKNFPGYITAKSPASVQPYFSAPFGVGTIAGLFRIDALTLLNEWEQYVRQNEVFRNSCFDATALQVFGDHIVYKDIRAEKIIFCEGASAIGNPFFERLPFTQNRGEALLLDIPDLPQDHVYHRKLRLIPKGNDQFWCGSNYIWNAASLVPSQHWKEEAVAELNAWLSVPFTIKDHVVARRPTTAGQFPLLGLHPLHTPVAICNGLGTRGFSAGPYWTQALANVLTGVSGDIPGYDTGRFQKFF